MAESDRTRLIAGLGSAALQALLGYALITGLAARIPAAVHDSLSVFAVLPEPPPPVELVVRKHTRTAKANGRAAPPALKAKAAAVVAPPAVLIPDVPPPVAAALTAGAGTQDHAGAAPAPGPGSGLAGEGSGTGSGDEGDGEGDGEGKESQWKRGFITDADYPRAAYEAGASGTVYLRFVVGIDGRVSSCAVTRSSGNAALDETTCRLIKLRFRYKPARDAQGRKVADVWPGRHVWTLTPPKPDQ